MADPEKPDPEKPTTASSGLAARAAALPRSFALLPMYAVLAYTMGLPGVTKLFHADTVMPRYVQMFEPTFIDDFPGTVLSIYALGVLEVAAAVLLVISAVRLEFLPGRVHRPFLDWGFFTTCVTFMALGFGQRVLSERTPGPHPGTFNQFVYASLTFLVWWAVRPSAKQTAAVAGVPPAVSP